MAHLNFKSVACGSSAWCFHNERRRGIYADVTIMFNTVGIRGPSLWHGCDSMTMENRGKAHYKRKPCKTTQVLTRQHKTIKKKTIQDNTGPYKTTQDCTRRGLKMKH